MNGFSQPVSTPPKDDRRRFVQKAPGNAPGARRMRREFAGWLQRHFLLDTEGFSDLVLAVNEAVTNAVEHGCTRDARGRETVAVAAFYDDDTDTLAVTITDEGHWRRVDAEPPTAPSQYQRHGYGLPLLRLLTDETRIDTSERGTHVLLRWTNLLSPTNPRRGQRGGRTLRTTAP
ncbi:hypothetical protein A5653_02385 [Mycobacterium colombiense]|nr:hypothetical protein A5653_02385 [Mycobacterium colombiense]